MFFEVGLNLKTLSSPVRDVTGADTRQQVDQATQTWYCHIWRQYSTLADILGTVPCGYPRSIRSIASPEASILTTVAKRRFCEERHRKLVSLWWTVWRGCKMFTRALWPSSFDSSGRRSNQTSKMTPNENSAVCVTCCNSIYVHSKPWTKNHQLPLSRHSLRWSLILTQCLSGKKRAKIPRTSLTTPSCWISWISGRKHPNLPPLNHRLY